jgi:hypothetical protein
MGDILFNSIWDLLDRPQCTPEGMVKISLTPWDGKKAAWRDIYPASGNGTVITSVFMAAYAQSISWLDAVDYGHMQGKRLLNDSEYQIMAAGSNEKTNVFDSTEKTNCIFPVDTAGRSMISTYGVICACGFMWQILDEQMWKFAGAANHTHEVTVSGGAETVTSANPSGDVAPIFSWKTGPLSAGKGDLYVQGVGDVKMLAGGAYTTGSNAGSRCRFMAQPREYTSNSCCARYGCDPA